MTSIHFSPVGATRVERCRIVGAFALLVTAAGVSSTDDPYLQLIDEEVTKVEVQQGDAAMSGIATAAPGAGGKVSAGVSREAFEALLRERHVGTYSFYRRLPERSRQEIYLDYSNGASITLLRDKIVDRFLHP